MTNTPPNNQANYMQADEHWQECAHCHPEKLYGKLPEDMICPCKCHLHQDTEKGWERIDGEVFAFFNENPTPTQTRDFCRKLVSQTRVEVLDDLFTILEERPVRNGMPRHLLALDLHYYADIKGISLQANTEPEV